LALAVESDRDVFGSEGRGVVFPIDKEQEHRRRRVADDALRYRAAEPGPGVAPAVGTEHDQRRAALRGVPNLAA
jgi:hypothetical protein